MFNIKYLIFLSIISCYSSCAEPSPKYRCDYLYDSGSKAFYKYHKIPSNWYDARLICFSEDAILAAPTNPEINAVMTKAASMNAMHTGYHSIHNVGNYYSIDGQPLEVPMTAWVKDEPDNKNDTERCLAMDTKGSFYDTECSKPMPFICMRSNLDIKYGDCGLESNGYILYERVWKCYKFHLVPRNYSRASFVCAAEGGHLIVVNDTKEATVVRDLFKENRHDRFPDPNVNKDIAFIGFHNFGEQNEYRTIHGHPLWEYYNDWQGGHPNGQSCGGMSRDWIKLWDIPCDKPHVFICEKPMNFPPACSSPQGETDLKTRTWTMSEPSELQPIQLHGKKNKDASENIKI